MATQPRTERGRGGRKNRAPAESREFRLLLRVLNEGDPGSHSLTGIILAGSFKPSDGLEPSTPSLPSSNEAGTAGNHGSGRPRKSGKLKETAEDE